MQPFGDVVVLPAGAGGREELAELFFLPIQAARICPVGSPSISPFHMAAKERGLSRS